MPVVINEIVIRTNIEQPVPPAGAAGSDAEQVSIENIVGQAVEKVLEILEEKKQR